MIGGKLGGHSAYRGCFRASLSTLSFVSDRIMCVPNGINLTDLSNPPHVVPYVDTSRAKHTSSTLPALRWKIRAPSPGQLLSRRGRLTPSWTAKIRDMACTRGL